MKQLLILLLLPLQVAAQTASLHLDDVPLADLIKVVYGEIAKTPFIMTTPISEARQPVSISMKGRTVEEVVKQTDQLLVVNGFNVQRRAGVVWIDKAKPVTERHLVYYPKYRSAKYLADLVSEFIHVKPVFRKSEIHQDFNQEQKKGQGDPGQVAVATKSNSPGQDVDQLALVVPGEKFDQVQKLLVQLDRPTGEVLLKAAVYEVGTGSKDASGLQLALNVAGISASVGGAIAATNTARIAQGGIQAVFAALDTDSRFKSISRPQVRVRNGATARFAVGQEVPVLGSQSLDRNGNPLQSVDYKQSGIILTAKPEIRQEEIELELSQEMSNFITTTTGVNNSPTLIKRSVNTKLTIQPGEVVILAGLQGDKTDSNQDSLPFVGWLLGQSSQREQSEILVFIEAEKI